MLNTVEALKNFAADYSKSVVNKTGYLPQVIHDSEWVSPCEQNDADDGVLVQWQWCEQPEPLNFSDLEQALEITFHQDIKDYYGAIYSGALFASLDRAVDGEQVAEPLQIELLQMWNQQDFERLGENFVGHILMQKKLKLEHTIFIGCVVNSEKMISVDNASGEVIIETAGDKNRLVVAGSLNEFLTLIKPLTEPEQEDEYQAPTEQKAGLLPRLKEIFNSLRGR